MNTEAPTPLDRWNTLPWKPIQRNVCQLQTRLSRAAGRDDVQTVRKLQRVLMHSWSAKLLAVRKVTQDNQGQKTPGVDGSKSFPPPQRRTVARTFPLDGTAAPVRRVWIPPPSPPELRPLGMPPIQDRAGQAGVKSALEPAWEARLAPHSAGVRPGRSWQEAIAALFTARGPKAK
jgi:RNA-directed DNA polymerase